jgi:hypothetical protein
MAFRLKRCFGVRMNWFFLAASAAHGSDEMIVTVLGVLSSVIFVVS